MSANPGVLVIYTGGTIGAVPTDADDPTSPLAAAPWGVLRADLPELDVLDFTIAARATRSPLDSSNIVTDDWREIATIVLEEYDRYDGFVVLHGTDTMAYSASALSFMLGELAKPVVFTGAQIPVVGNPDSDGRGNLLGALTVANRAASGLPVVPEVCLFFHDRLLRGNRATKIDSAGLKAFDSPNCEPLGLLRSVPGSGSQSGAETMSIRAGALSRGGDRPTRLHLQPNVVPVQLYPGIQHSSFFRQTFADPTIRAIVLQTYGVGNGPSDPAFLDILREAAKTKVIVNITQCLAGAIAPGRYATSSGFSGIVANGSDMTLEAAMTKLMVLLADPSLSHADVFAQMETDLAGERS